MWEVALKTLKEVLEVEAHPRHTSISIRCDIGLLDSPINILKKINSIQMLYVGNKPSEIRTTALLTKILACISVFPPILA